jgi:hypothetical protein
MRAWGLLALAGGLVGSGCAGPAQTADPSPVLASQSELAYVRKAITPCLRKAWVPPGKGRPLRVTLRWQLDEDGRLVGDPEVVNSQSIPPDSPAAQAAVKAVRACEPYRLRLDKYHLWKAIVFSFDAAAM